jgi:hypothetical protein
MDSLTETEKVTENITAIKWIGGGRARDWRYCVRWDCPNCGRTNWQKDLTTTQEEEPKTLPLVCKCGAEHTVGPYIHAKKGI